MRLAPAVVASGLLLMIVAVWPGLDQPGRPIREALLLVAAPLLLALAAAGPSRRVPARLWAPLALAALAGLLGVARAPATEAFSVTRDLLVLGCGWLLALAAAMLPAETSAADRDRGAQLGVPLALGLLGAAGVAQAWFGWDALPQGAPPAGTFVNRNVAAQTLVALVPLAFGGLLAGTTQRARWSAGLATGLGLAFLVATRARGAWLALAAGCGIGLVAFALATRGRRSLPRVRQVAGPMVLIVAIFVLSLLAPIGADPKGSVGETIRSLSVPSAGTGAIRLAFWRNGLEMLRDEPLLGVGTGRFAVVYPLYQQARTRTPGFGTGLQLEHAHNDWLEFAADLGLPGALALLFLFVGAVARSFRAVLSATTSGERARATARAAALTGILVHGLLSFPLHSPASSFLAWFLVGRAWAEEGSSPKPLRARPAVLTFAAILALCGGWFGVREIRSQRALSEALRAHAGNACLTAIAASDRARDAAPWRRRETGMAAMIRFECDRDPGRSLESLEPALALQPNNLNLLLATGSRRLKSGDPGGGAEAFQRTVRISPQLGRGWLGLAMSRDAADEREQAETACRNAVRLSPQLREARLFCEGNGYVGR